MCKDKRMCQCCGKRPALCQVKGKGKWAFRKDHDMCRQCWDQACRQCCGR